MNKWFDEDISFEIEVIGVSHDGKTINHCRNGDEIGDIYRCTYDCPVNQNGRGFCSKSMMIAFPIMEAARSGGDLRNLGGDSEFTKEFMCPDGVVKFRLTAQKNCTENFHTGGYYKD